MSDAGALLDDCRSDVTVTCDTVVAGVVGQARLRGRRIITAVVLTGIRTQHVAKPWGGRQAKAPKGLGICACTA